MALRAQGWEGEVGRGGLTGLPILVGLILLAACPARADHIRILLERENKGGHSVVTLRQELDMTHGLDRFFLEELQVPENQRLSSVELAAEWNALGRKTGQYELFVKKVEEEKERALAQFVEKGYQPVCNLLLADTPDRRELPFSSQGRELRMQVVLSKKDYVILKVGEDKTYTLVTFKDGGDKNRESGEIQVVARVMAQVALLDGGRTLGVVVRNHQVPSPPFVCEDLVLLFPMKRAAQNLGLAYPLAVEPCAKPPAAEEETP
jgi:hypothetical protein